MLLSFSQTPPHTFQIFWGKIPLFFFFFFSNWKTSLHWNSIVCAKKPHFG